MGSSKRDLVEIIRDSIGYLLFIMVSRFDIDKVKNMKGGVG